MKALGKMAMEHFRDINNHEIKLSEDELIFRAEKLEADIRRWLRAKADFDPKEGE